MGRKSDKIDGGHARYVRTDGHIGIVIRSSRVQGSDGLSICTGRIVRRRNLANPATGASSGGMLWALWGVNGLQTANVNIAGAAYRVN